MCTSVLSSSNNIAPRYPIRLSVNFGDAISFMHSNWKYKELKLKPIVFCSSGCDNQFRKRKIFVSYQLYYWSMILNYLKSITDLCYITSIHNKQRHCRKRERVHSQLLNYGNEWIPSVRVYGGTVTSKLIGWEVLRWHWSIKDHTLLISFTSNSISTPIIA